MKLKLLFSPEALEDIESIYRYHAKRNEVYAVELYNRIIEEAEQLQYFPKMTPTESLLEEYPEEYRSLIVQHHYKLVYFIENETVNVVVVFDCRQNPEKLKTNIRETQY